MIIKKNKMIDIDFRSKYRFGDKLMHNEKVVSMKFNDVDGNLFINKACCDCFNKYKIKVDKYGDIYLRPSRNKTDSSDYYLTRIKYSDVNTLTLVDDDGEAVDSITIGNSTFACLGYNEKNTILTCCKKGGKLKNLFILKDGIHEVIDLCEEEESEIEHFKTIWDMFLYKDYGDIFYPLDKVKTIKLHAKFNWAIYDEILEALHYNVRRLLSLGVKRIDVYTYESVDDLITEFDDWNFVTLCQGYMVDKYGVIKETYVNCNGIKIYFHYEKI